LKAGIASILAIFYIILSLGIDIDIHMCHNRIKDIHFGQNVNDLGCPKNNHSCCTGSKDESIPFASSCCSHEEFYLEAVEFQALLNKDKLCSIILSPILAFQYELKPEISQVSDYSFTPPPIVPLFLKEHRFTFYG
jgi:hypothetical protein